MEFTGAGTAIMVALAAALWFAYFVPTWMRRREYLDTERTATRLQQTLRVMAETAELPDQVRLEVTARDAARHERLLAAEQRRADAIAARTAAEVRAASRAPVASLAPPGSATSARRLRRRRAHRIATLLMIAATFTIGVQLWLVAAGTAGPGAWLVFTAGAGLGIAGVAVRRRLDMRAAREAPAARPTLVSAPPERVPAAPALRAWTPVAIPAPLYLSRPEAQLVQPAMDLAAQLREAALASERALRDAHDTPEVVPLRPRRAPAPERRPASIELPAMRADATSRWASMGRLDGLDAAAPDLDEVLRRRRNAG